MIWVRRFFAVILAVVLLAVLVGAVMLRTAKRATDPAFLKAELVKVDAYGFLYDDVLDKYAGDQIEDQLGRGLESGPAALAEFTFEDPARAREVILDAIKETFPPEYTQEQVEAALDELLPYLKGETDAFEIRPELDERARAAARAISTVIDELNLADQVIDRAIAPNLDNALNQFSIGGAQLNITPERARDIAHRIAPEEWVNAQINNALGEFIAWLTGDQDTFTVRIQFADRVPAARDEIKALLREAEFTDFLFDTVIEPRLTEAVGRLSALSFGITVTNEEVKVALEKAAPKEWVDQQLSGLIDILAGYISGASDELAFTIPLADRRAATIDALTSLADTKLRQIAARLPVCGTAGDVAQAASRLSSFQLPTCLPQGVDASAVVNSLLPVLRTDLERVIGANFPKQITFERSLLESQLGADAFAAFDQARELIGGGFAWTEADLSKALADASSGSSVNLEDVRKVFQNDYTLTQDDLRKDMDAAAIQQFDSTRSTLRTIFGLGWLTIVLPLVLAVAIGFLGGRRWYSRLAWGAGALGITSLIVWIAIAQAYGRIQPRLHEELVDSTVNIEDEGQRRLALAAIDKVEIVIDDVVAGASGFARTWTILGVLGVASAAGWMYYSRTAETGETAVSRWVRARFPARRKVAAETGPSGSGTAGGTGGSGEAGQEPSRPPSQPAG